MNKLSHLNALRALEAAVRQGSFRAAAAELGVTPAAVGQQVRNLEEALGHSLLQRGPNGFQPTAAALAGVEKLTSGFESLREAVGIMAQSPAGNRVFVTVTPTIGERWLAPRLSRFLARHSEVDLRIDSTPYVHYRPGEEFDFAIRYDRPGVSGHSETALFNEILIPLCTPEVAKKLGPPENADCLSDVPLLHVDRSTDDPAWLHWDEWGETFGYRIPKKQQRLQITFTTLALRALYDGHGLHLSQLSITLPDLLSGRLVAPFGAAACVRPGYPYSLVQMNYGQESQLQRAFRDWVVEEGKETKAAMERFVAESPTVRVAPETTS